MKLVFIFVVRYYFLKIFFNPLLVDLFEIWEVFWISGFIISNESIKVKNK